MWVTFTKEKETKNTIRFMEESNEGIEGLDETALGTIYVPKSTLKAIGWSEDKELVIELSVK